MSLQKTLTITESADILQNNKYLSELHPSSSSKSPVHMMTQENLGRNIEDLSLSSLNAHKRRSLKIVDKINKNIAKLHKHTNVNWSLKDLPLSFFK